MATLITGASGGLGRYLAAHLAKKGQDLVLTGRDLGALEALQESLQPFGVATWVFPVDLTQFPDREELFKKFHSESIVISCLINNAGVGLAGPFGNQDAKRQIDLLDLNVEALTHLCRLFLDQVPRDGFRGILNVSSVGAFLPGPNTAIYYASKAYVLSFTVALAQELRSEGIHVSAFCPGSLDTHFHQIAGNENSPKMKFRKSWIPLEKAAAIAWKGLGRNQRIVIPGILNRLGAGLLRHLPPSISAWLFSRFS